jgi:hypothetical protein
MRLFAMMENRFEYHDIFVTRREWFAIETGSVPDSANLILS